MVESISDHLIEGVLTVIMTKFPTQVTTMDQLLKSRFYSGLHSWIWDDMTDMFRNLAYDVTALMKAAWDLDDEHALDWGQQQTTTKVTSMGGLGDLPLEP